MNGYEYFIQCLSITLLLHILIKNNKKSNKKSVEKRTMVYLNREKVHLIESKVAFRNRSKYNSNIKEQK